MSEVSNIADQLRQSLATLKVTWTDEGPLPKEEDDYIKKLIESATENENGFSQGNDHAHG
jgi:hypothetical protein